MARRAVIRRRPAHLRFCSPLPPRPPKKRHRDSHRRQMQGGEAGALVWLRYAIELRMYSSRSSTFLRHRRQATQSLIQGPQRQELQILKHQI